MRVVALLATFNEERFVAGLHRAPRRAGCRRLPDRQRVDRRHRRDRASATAAAASSGSRLFPRDGVYSWRRCCGARRSSPPSIDADWFLHVDADEIRLPPRSGITLAEALAEVDRQGYNAVNFLEFTFVPTRRGTRPRPPAVRGDDALVLPVPASFPDRLNAWKRQAQPVDLAPSGGHRVDFPGLRMYPESFRMRHYLFLSADTRSASTSSASTTRGGRGGQAPERAALRRRTSTLLPERSCASTSPTICSTLRPSTQHPLFARVQTSAVVSERGSGRSSSAAAIARARASSDASWTPIPRSTAGPRSRSSATSTATTTTTRCAPAVHATARALVLPEDEALDVLGRAFVELHERAARRAGKVRWADKAPENVLYTAEWERLLGEQWLFVHVVRNPLDTVASMQGRFPLTLPAGVAEAALYRTYTQAGLTFEQADPDRCLRVVYEELCDAPRRPSNVDGMARRGVRAGAAHFQRTAHQTGFEDPEIATTDGVHRKRGPLAVAAQRRRGCARMGSNPNLWETIDPARRFSPM